MDKREQEQREQAAKAAAMLAQQNAQYVAACALKGNGRCEGCGQ